MNLRCSIMVLMFLIKIYFTIGHFADFNVQQKLIEHFLNVRNLDSVILYTCWSLAGNYTNLQYYTYVLILLSMLIVKLTDRMKNMKNLNDKYIAVTYRNRHFAADGHYGKEDTLELSLYSPSLGVIVDWSCNDDLMIFQVYNIFIRTYLKYQCVYLNFKYTVRV